ncbi:MAG: hypothetical protein U1E10_19390 [Bdellovibrionales bacterium]|nr:hypothetical protein [Bdellovibrionales bacterium]
MSIGRSDSLKKKRQEILKKLNSFKFAQSSPDVVLADLLSAGFEIDLPFRFESDGNRSVAIFHFVIEENVCEHLLEVHFEDDQLVEYRIID